MTKQEINKAVDAVMDVRRQEFWARFAAEAMGAYIVDGKLALQKVAYEAALMADRMLKEWDERFATKK